MSREDECGALLAQANAARAEAEAVATRLRAIQTITTAALQHLALDDSLQEMLLRTCTVLGAEAAAILLATEDDRDLVLRAGHGLELADQETVRISLERGLISRLAAHPEPMAVDDLTQVADAPPLLRQRLRSLMGAPLRVEGGAIGVTLIGTTLPRRFSDEDRGLLQVVADRAAALIDHARLFEQVRAGRARAQRLSQQLLEAQEAERRRLARELHDEIGQALTAVKINLQGLERSGAAATGPRLEESIAIVDRALQQVRNLSLDLRPSLLDDLGLVAALRWYADRQAQRAGLAVEFVADPPGIRATSELETACFRVAQEALTNIVRHAQARSVHVELRQQDPELRLLIRDDGVGFDVAAARQRALRGGSLGILGMQERVGLLRGRLDIRSTPQRGTEIHVRLPLTAHVSLERRGSRRGPQ
jgi:signal transduction histidine kinase